MITHDDLLQRAMVLASLLLVLTCTGYVAAPVPPVKQEVVPKPEVKEPAAQKTPSGPQAFARVDFTNRLYGRYRFSTGKRMNLKLKDGELVYDYRSGERGWFIYENVYYKDVTGDGTPEAVVMLSHIQCGGSCDGGSTLMYVYATRKGKLQRLWKYETGSLGYGCGLKSLTIHARQIVLETFGRCFLPATDNPGPRKFMIEDVTRSVFRFNGRSFTRRSLKIMKRPATDVTNYQSEIRID